MKTTVVLFTYNRPELLRECVDVFKDTDYDVWILDDGSDYDETLFHDVNYIRLPHTGKRGFAQKWVDALYICEQSDSDRFMFLPDDFINLDLSRVDYLSKQLKNKAYAFNVYNCSRDKCWTGVRPVKRKVGKEQVTVLGFVDCGFVCNRKTLEKIEFTMPHVHDSWHNRRDKSSGVGYSMSHLFVEKGIYMFTPVTTLCDHGHSGHKSKMHPEGNEGIEIDTALVLNLNERPDKLDTFYEQEFPFEVSRAEAIKASPGWVGCRDSHFRILEGIKGVTLVMEDDCKIIEDWKLVERAMNQLPKDWDLLYLGATLNTDLKKYSDNLYRLQDGWTTHAIIYNGRRVADFVLKCKNKVQKIDVFYADVVQHRFNCFITYPMAATQREGFSDVINRHVDYKVITDRYQKYT